VGGNEILNNENQIMLRSLAVQVPQSQGQKVVRSNQGNSSVTFGGELPAALVVWPDAAAGPRVKGVKTKQNRTVSVRKETICTSLKFLSGA
tara:strand:- start:101 stop:373 length:273 start_codon:yes stop_codon:yes gene_type:complete